MMPLQEVVDFIIKDINEELFMGLVPEEINSNTSFNSIGLDLLDSIGLIMDIEAEFDIHIPDEYDVCFMYDKTINDAASAVVAHLYKNNKSKEIVYD